MGYTAMKNYKKTIDKINMDYKCPYCKYEFSQYVGTKSGRSDKPVSSQVKCPSCTNFLKTW